MRPSRNAGCEGVTCTGMLEEGGYKRGHVRCCITYLYVDISHIFWESGNIGMGSSKGLGVPAGGTTPCRTGIGEGRGFTAAQETGKAQELEEQDMVCGGRGCSTEDSDPSGGVGCHRALENMLRHLPACRAEREGQGSGSGEDLELLCSHTHTPPAYSPPCKARVNRSTNRAGSGPPGPGGGPGTYCGRWCSAAACPCTPSLPAQSPVFWKGRET